ncbi:MAG: hypothetical protein LBT97_11640 [Planctomycetota bacterium]|nr:hypothetical protein [Planctomycetota bacterium]
MENRIPVPPCPARGGPGQDMDLKFCKMAIKPPIAILQKSKTLVAQGSRFLQIGHSAV